MLLGGHPHPSPSILTRPLQALTACTDLASPAAVQQWLRHRLREVRRRHRAGARHQRRQVQVRRQRPAAQLGLGGHRGRPGVRELERPHLPAAQVSQVAGAPPHELRSARAHDQRQRKVRLARGLLSIHALALPRHLACDGQLRRGGGHRPGPARGHRRRRLHRDAARAARGPGLPPAAHADRQSLGNSRRHRGGGLDHQGLAWRGLPGAQRPLVC